MAGAMEGNAAKSEGGAARMLDICNAFRDDEDSVGQRVREGWELTQGDEATAVEFGLLYDSLEAPPEAPLTAEAAPEVLTAIRGDSIWLDTKSGGRIVKSILNTSNSPSESRRKWYNQIGATEEHWLTSIEWDLCKDIREMQPDDRVVMFFDGSKSDDATALVGCRLSDGYVFRIGIWERPPKRQDWLVDRAEVNLKVEEAFDSWDVVGFWGDPSDARDDETGERYWEPYLDEWAEKYKKRLKLPAVKTGDGKHLITWDMRSPQHQKVFVEHAERFTSDVRGEALVHDGTRRLRQHVINARRRPNKYGVSLGKENRESRKKVDGAVCAVGARMMWRIAASNRIRSGAAVTRKGVVLG
jgi:hypothetical protein